MQETMQETLQEQYGKTQQLLNANRAQQKVLIDAELGLVSRLAALEDLVRGVQQKEKQAEQMKKDASGIVGKPEKAPASPKKDKKK